MRAFTSKRPYCQAWSPLVVTLAEVYSANARRLPQYVSFGLYPGFGLRSRRPSMIRQPLEQMALSG
jgi:hypothetical protein